jgi:hypothetical protein
MTRTLSLLVAIVALVAGLAGPACPQPAPPPPVVAVPPQPPPPMPHNAVIQWVPAPGNPKVLYAPNIPGNLFRLHKKFYYYYGGQWYRGKSPLGPWHPVRKVPAGLLRLHPSAFKH